MKGIEIKDIRPTSNLVNIGSLSIEQVFQFKDGGYGMIVDHDRPHTITAIYTIESGGVNP